MGGVLVCAQAGDGSTTSPNAPAIADVASTLGRLHSDDAAVFIVLVTRETSLRSGMMDSFYGKRCESDSIGCGTRNAIRPDASKRIYWTMVLIDEINDPPGRPAAGPATFPPLGSESRGKSRPRSGFA